MKIKDGFITKDNDGTTKFHREKPICYGTFWASDGYVFIDLDMFVDLERPVVESDYDVDDSIWQVLNGKLIDPLPDLKTGDSIRVLVGNDWVQKYFSHYDRNGRAFIFAGTVPVEEKWLQNFSDE